MSDQEKSNSSDSRPVWSDASGEGAIRSGAAANDNAARQENRARLKERRAALKAAGRCINCAAGLTHRGVYCLECYEKNRQANARYYQRHRDRMLEESRAKRLRRLARDPDYERRDRHEAYQRDKLAGICTDCNDPSTDDSCFCAFHLEVNRTRSRNRYRIKAHGDRAVLDPVPTRESRAPRVRLDPVEVDGTAPAQPRECMADRLLRFLRWSDWTSSREMGDALDFDDTERNAASKALGRLVLAGLVERRGAGPSADYQLTAAGRRKADELRNARAVP